MHKAFKALALASACGLAVCAEARADEVYTFTGSPDPGDPALTPILQLEVTNAAVAAGGFVLSGTDTVRGNILTGDTSEFVGMSLGYFGALPASYALTPSGSGIYSGSENFAINLDIAPSGALDGAGTISVSDTEGDGTGVLIQANGAYQLEYDGAARGAENCIGSFKASCDGTGAWTYADPPGAPVPEPASLGLLGVGLIGLAAVRRRLA